MVIVCVAPAPTDLILQTVACRDSHNHQSQPVVFTCNRLNCNRSAAEAFTPPNTLLSSWFGQSSGVSNATSGDPNTFFSSVLYELVGQQEPRVIDFNIFNLYMAAAAPPSPSGLQQTVPISHSSPHPYVCSVPPTHRCSVMAHRAEDSVPRLRGPLLHPKREAAMQRGLWDTPSVDQPVVGVRTRLG